LSTEPLPGLTVDLAGRYENYSDAGDALAGKIAARYALNDSVGIRGSVSNSFRAPSLAQTAFQFSSTSFGTGGALTTVRTVAPGSAIGRALGAPELDPETSVNFSAGVTAQFGDFGLSLDAFRIDVDDRIIVSERNSGFAALIEAETGIQNVTEVAVFTNGANTRTEGLELVGTWDGTVGPGDLGLTLAYALAETEVRDVNVASSWAPGYVVLGVEERNTIESAAPEANLTGSALYTVGPYGILLRATQHGETTRIFNFGGGFEPEQTYGAKTSVDFEVSYDLSERIELALGGNNIFDEYPDRSIADIAYFDALPYDVLSPVGINGAYWYVRTRLTF
jgi:iron complex outermembrane recepter protein